MGMFSGHCKGCREAVNDNEDSALVQMGIYSGYGMNGHDVQHYWHKKCYAKVLKASAVTMCQSAHDEDQGMSAPNPEHIEYDNEKDKNENLPR